MSHADRVVSRDEELRYLMAAPPLLKDVATIFLDCGLRCPLSDIDIWPITLEIPRLGRARDPTACHYGTATPHPLRQLSVNITRAGGNAPLFDRMLNGLERSLSGHREWIANGEVGAVANFINNTNAFGGARGQLLRNAGLPENFIVVNPQFGSVTLHGNNDNSTYHSLVTQETKRMSHGVTGQSAYVGENVGQFGPWDMSQNTDTTSVVRDPHNRSLQEGPVSFDRRHQFNAFGTWALPFGPNRGILASAPGWMSRIVEGWQVSGVFNWESGTPLD